jgi:hypothetical protein
MGSSNNPTNEDELLLSRVYNDFDVYNEFGDKQRDIENWKLCKHMKR